jgi:hypothetical protein
VRGAAVVDPERRQHIVAGLDVGDEGLPFARVEALYVGAALGLIVNRDLADEELPKLLPPTLLRGGRRIVGHGGIASQVHGDGWQRTLIGLAASASSAGAGCATAADATGAGGGATAADATTGRGHASAASAGGASAADATAGRGRASAAGAGGASAADATAGCSGAAAACSNRAPQISGSGRARLASGLTAGGGLGCCPAPTAGGRLCCSSLAAGSCRFGLAARCRYGPGLAAGSPGLTAAGGCGPGLSPRCLLAAGASRVSSAATGPAGLRYTTCPLR